MLLLGAALFDRNVVWIVTSGEILIGEQRPFGNLHRRSIRDDELSGCVCEGASANRSNSPSYSRPDREIHSPRLHCLTSPRCKEPSCRLRGCFSCLPELVENPLDAANAAIRLGKPVGAKRVAHTGLSSCCWPARWPFHHLRALERQIVRPRNRCRVIRRDHGLLLIRHLYRASGYWIVQWRPQDRAAVVEGDDRGHNRRR